MKTKTIINLLTLTTLTLLLTTTSCTKTPIPKPKQPDPLDLRTSNTDHKNTIQATIFQAQLINDQVHAASRQQPGLDTGPDYPTVDLNDQDELIIIDDQSTQPIVTSSQGYRFPSGDRTFRIGNRIRAFLSMMNVYLPSGILQAVSDQDNGHFYFESVDPQALRILIACKKEDGGRFSLVTTHENGQRNIIVRKDSDARSTNFADNRIGIIPKLGNGRYMLFENVPAMTTVQAEIPFDLSFDAWRPRLQLSSLLPIRPNGLNLFTDSCYPNNTLSGIEDTDTYQLEDNRYIMEVDVEPSYWYCLLNQPSFQLSFKVN